jgi:cystathionine beta-lyase/cystathionine gamma-synthase
MFNPESISTTEKTDGLPSLEQINDQVLRLSGAVKLKKKKGSSDYLDDLAFARSRQIEHVKTADYEKYKDEFQEDVEDLQLRFMRLKIRLLTPYIRYTLHTALEESKDYQEKDKSLGARLIDMIYEEDNKYKGITGGLRQAVLLKKINQYLPEEYRFNPDQEIALWDLDMLRTMVYSGRFGEKLLDEKEKQPLEALLNQVCHWEDVLGGTTQQQELALGNNSKGINEERIAEVWGGYRQLLKEIANLEERESWFSPTYGSSGKGQTGKNQESARLRTDYQRFKMTEIETLESSLEHHYFRGKSDFSRTGCVLFNNGMNALEAIMIHVDAAIAARQAFRRRRFKPIKEDKVASGSDIYDHEPPIKPPRPVVLLAKDLYFEAEGSVRDHYRNRRNIPVVEVDPTDEDNIVNQIKTKLPVAVFLNPMSNHFDMHVTKVKKILQDLIDDESWHTSLYKYPSDFEINIIIDNSTLGRLAEWPTLKMLSNFARIKIFCLESLVKYAQDGQELVSAGMVVAMGEYAGSELSDIRARKGFMPTENAARRLKMVAMADMTDKRMARHSRNAMYVGKTLEKSAKIPNSIIGRIMYPGLESHPDYEAAKNEMTTAGGLLNVEMSWSFLEHYQEDTLRRREINYYDITEKITEAFIKLAVTLAKGGGVEINKGNSYGFNVTRLARYDRRASKEEIKNTPGMQKRFSQRFLSYIRMAVGTENIKDIMLIATIMNRVNEIFAQAIADKQLFALMRKILSGDTEIIVNDQKI